MRKILVLFITFLAVIPVNAQFIQEQATNVSIGLGMTAPYEHLDVRQSPGVYAQGEYVLSPASWIDFRPYAGLILTKFKENDSGEAQARYRSSANALLLGGKTRITAPVPFVAPFFEIGVGASVGSFETYTPTTSIEESGVFVHIPVSLGLKIESLQDVDLRLTSYFHTNLQQFTGAAAIGLSFPIY